MAQSAFDRKLIFLLESWTFVFKDGMFARLFLGPTPIPKTSLENRTVKQ